MWKARFFEALDDAPNTVPELEKAAWLLLTLTVRNCEITDLRHAPWTSYLVSARTIELPLPGGVVGPHHAEAGCHVHQSTGCLLYTSDAADE